MPGGDGTGPMGAGPGTGWGRGPCRGGGRFGHGGGRRWRGMGSGGPAGSGETSEASRLSAEVERLGRKLADMEARLKGQDKAGEDTK